MLNYDWDKALELGEPTERQREVIAAYVREGSDRGAAAALGVHHSSVRKARLAVQSRAARAGYAPGHFEAGTAPGYRMGKVTVQRGPGGVERVWERQHPQEEARLDALREAVEGIVSDMRGLAPIVPPPAISHDDIITVYPLGDAHCGLRAWRLEAGEDFDLTIFEERMKAAIDRLVYSAPASKEALFINVGDYFHADDGSNRTPTGNNALDVDGRHAKIATIALRCMIYAINRLREKHEKITVWNKGGNHDPHAWLMLAMSLNAYFHDDPRVDVPVDPCMFSYMRFGKCLFGSTHGHGPKIAELPMIMATDRAQDWGQTEYRVWFIGHFHHRQVVQDMTGCTVEIARTLAAGDAWHHGKGYRSYKDMQAIVFHKDGYELDRHSFSVAMLK